MSAPELHAVETVELPGRGMLHIVQNAAGFDEPNDLRGQDVLLDGTLVRVDGVETFAIGRPYPPRLPFGLLVVAAEFAAFKKEMAEMVMDTCGVPEAEREMWRDLR